MKKDVLMRTVLWLFLLAVTVAAAFGQTSPEPPRQKVDTWGLYTGVYDLEMAKKFEWRWEYEKAVWTYINMMGGADRKMAIQRVKGLKSKVGDLTVFINITFDTYVKFDPEVQVNEDGVKALDPSLYQKKRTWADELIQAVQ